MNDIKITPSEIKNFAANIGTWASQLGIIEIGLRSKLQGLGDAWKDIRFVQFYDILSSNNRHIKSMQEQFSQLQQDLKKMADRLDDEISHQKTMLNKYK